MLFVHLVETGRNGRQAPVVFLREETRASSELKPSLPSFSLLPLLTFFPLGSRLIRTLLSDFLGLRSLPSTGQLLPPLALPHPRTVSPLSSPSSAMDRLLALPLPPMASSSSSSSKRSGYGNKRKAGDGGSKGKGKAGADGGSKEEVDSVVHSIGASVSHRARGSVEWRVRVRAEGGLRVEVRGLQGIGNEKRRRIGNELEVESVLELSCCCLLLPSTGTPFGHPATRKVTDSCLFIPSSLSSARRPALPSRTTRRTSSVLQTCRMSKILSSDQNSAR